MLSALPLRWNGARKTRDGSRRWKSIRNDAGIPFGRIRKTEHQQAHSQPPEQIKNVYSWFCCWTLSENVRSWPDPKYLCATNIKMLQMPRKKRQEKSKKEWRHRMERMEVGGTSNKSANGKHVVRWPWRKIFVRWCNCILLRWRLTHITVTVRTMLSLNFICQDVCDMIGHPNLSDHPKYTSGASIMTNRQKRLHIKWTTIVNDTNFNVVLLPRHNTIIIAVVAVTLSFYQLEKFCARERVSAGISCNEHIPLHAMASATVTYSLFIRVYF